jgi:hypothetical protein
MSSPLEVVWTEIAVRDLLQILDFDAGHNYAA